MAEVLGLILALKQCSIEKKKKKKKSAASATNFLPSSLPGKRFRAEAASYPDIKLCLVLSRIVRLQHYMIQSDGGLLAVARFGAESFYPASVA